MDARIVKTRARLQEALFALARERGLDEVSVSDIAERAGVNRSTFYQHYSDKETLLADALDVVAREAGANLDGIDIDALGAPTVLIDFLAHIEAHADLYHRVFTEPGYGVVLARLRAHVYEAIVSTAESKGLAPDIPADILAAGVAGSIVGVIGAWLERDPRPPSADAALWVWQVILGPPGG
ncbi:MULTISPECIES: TetR/AcrR family transcriptional regulator [Demequina]|uniref:TetR family transcriptional regulator n=1 Tax=Demequina litorisediminis TaxID=1849022 RepID=A0ABQ6IB45_9MICO|nr:TetR/AcrR family transcriptional regulator [Demequina litorisediminis]GMA34671.1 TetR family transcriptional regulator [Demequina litorisediminis]